MKKILLFIVALLSLQAHAQLQRVVNFDFSKENFWQSNLSNYVKPAGTNYSFSSFGGFNRGLLNFSFTKAAAGYNKDNEEFLLNLQQGATMTISVPAGSVLNSIVFDPTTVEVDLQLAAGEAGNYDHSTKTWTSSGAVNSVKFSNFTSSSYVWKMQVTYTEPSVILSATASPSSTDTPVSFSSLVLTYPGASGNMSVQNDTGITIQGNYADTAKGSVNTTMTASASGNKITLTVTPAITSDGTFTINIPARAFKDGEGYENVGMTTTVTVCEDHAIFNPVEVTPAEGNLTELPEVVKLKFDNDVTLAEIEPTAIVIKKDGTPKYTATLAIDETDQKIVRVKSSHNGNITNEEANLGVWTIDIPAAAIHNPFKGNAVYDLWNKDLTLTYTLIETPDPLKDQKAEVTALKQDATALIAKIGTVGYPKADDATSPLATAVDFEISAATTADDLETYKTNLEKAIKAFYNATDIVLPISQKWYTIASVNKAGSELALSYANGAVTLGGTATAFQVESITDGVAVLKVKAGKDSQDQTVYKYLHVLMDKENTTPTSSKNVTDTYTDQINKLTLAKLSIGTIGTDDQKPYAGLLTIEGNMGYVNEVPYTEIGSAKALVNHSTGKIITDKSETTLYFEDDKSSAFRFVETDEPSDEPVTPPVTINPTAMLTDVNQTSHTMTLTIGEVTKVTLKDASLAKILQDGTRDMSSSLTASTLIEAVSGSNYQFTIHVDGLTEGNYTLSLPVGTFKYYDEGVNEQALAPTFTISGGGSTPTPNPDPAIPVGNFLYTYKSGVYPATILGMYHTDESLNDFTIYTDMYSDLVADSRKSVKLTHADNTNNVYRTGKLEAYTASDYAKHPEWNADVKALKLVLDTPINKGDLQTGHYAFVFEPATFGDSNFRTWLADNSYTGSCVVNSRFAYDYNIDNEKATGISTVFVDGTSESVYTLDGRKLNGKPTTKGIYIVNGRKVVIK